MRRKLAAGRGASSEQSTAAGHAVPSVSSFPLPLRLGLTGLLFGFAVLLPHVFTNPLVSQIGFYALIYATMASAWNILGGYTGYFSLGHAAFFGIGGYSLAIICQDYQIEGGYAPFVLLPLVGLIAAAFAVPLGIISLRTRRHVFVVLTIAILFICQLLAYNLSNLTGGSTGALLPLAPWRGGDYNLPFYYVALLILAVVLATSVWIRGSKFGLGLLAIRDDEDRAAGLGLNVWLLKLIAFVIPAFFIGMAGATYFYFQGQIIPQFGFNPLDDLAMVLMSFAGGLGTVLGPAFGGLLIESAQQYFALEYGAGGYYLILYGGLFLIIILLMPRGVIPAIQLLWQKQRIRHRTAGGERHSTKPVNPAASDE
jgi:branched-chain amino acid transport system permease protein